MKEQKHRTYSDFFYFLWVVPFFLLCFFYTQNAYATVYLTRVSDLLSTSAPGAGANHTIRFTLTQPIPPSGTIDIRLDEGGFFIPLGGFTFGDIDVGFSASVGGPYTQRPLSSVSSPGTDGVTVTTGPAGGVRIRLNSSVGIPAGNEVEIKMGTNATYGATGDTRIQLSSTPASYPVTIRTYDSTMNELDYGRTMIVVIEQVTAGPVDTTDTTPPVILSAEPTGILQVGTRAVELYVVTDEYASCRYATSSMAYDFMPYFFYGTTSPLAIWHFALVTGLEDDTEYLFYLRCIDFRLNEIDPDYELAFVVGIAPGSATSTATSTGTGTGTGSASTTVVSGPGTGDDTGTGGGPTGTGSGNSPDGGDTAGSGGGGSGSSGGTSLPQSGVRISGWAYPNATVSHFRDGVAVKTESAGGDGSFNYLTEGLDRGSYSFGLYAIDSKGVRSATFSTTLWVRADTLTSVSNVMLPPTVSIEKNSLGYGEALYATGYTAPRAVVTASLRPRLAEVSSADIVATTTALSNGVWEITLPTTGLTVGTYEFSARASMEGGAIESDKSARKTVGVGVAVDEADGDCLSMGDLNCDGFVNLVDFSILLFNWNTTSSVADVNSDGVVSLPDFSVMLYNWTG